MSLLNQSKRALGCLFVKCSGIGLLDDPAVRSFKAALLIAAWLCSVLMSCFFAFSFWIYDAADVLRQSLPFLAENSRATGLALAIVFGVPSFLISSSVGREYSKKAKPKASSIDAFFVGLWYAGIVASLLLNLNRYGSLVCLALHAIFFLWLIRESNRDTRLAESI